MIFAQLSGNDVDLKQGRDGQFNLRHWLLYSLLLRLVQSLRRYVDSNSTIHLINVSLGSFVLPNGMKRIDTRPAHVQGGKYGFGIVQYFFYFLWQHHGTHAFLCHMEWFWPENRGRLARLELRSMVSFGFHLHNLRMHLGEWLVYLASDIACSYRNLAL